MNSGRGFLKARNRGCILPQQLHTDDFPTGVAPCCEYRGCFNQKQANGEPLISTRYGQFCSEEQARMAYYDWEGTTPSGDRLEVDGLHVKSREKRRKQVASIPVERV